MPFLLNWMASTTHCPANEPIVAAHQLEHVFDKDLRSVPTKTTPKKQRSKPQKPKAPTGADEEDSESEEEDEA